MSDSTILFTHLPDISLLDYTDERSLVFFTSGCNFRCSYCYNTPLLSKQTEGLTEDYLEKLLKKFKKSWVSAVVITGGEPLIHQGWQLKKVLNIFKKKKMKIKLDTNGSFPDKLEACLPLLNYVAMDVKAPLERYKELTGTTAEEQILKSIKIIRTSKKDYEFRVTAVEGFHKLSDFSHIGVLLTGAKLIALQGFTPAESVLEKSFLKYGATSHEFLEKAAERLEPYAKQVVIRGV